MKKVFSTIIAMLVSAAIASAGTALQAQIEKSHIQEKFGIVIQALATRGCDQS